MFVTLKALIFLLVEYKTNNLENSLKNLIPFARRMNAPNLSAAFHEVEKSSRETAARNNHNFETSALEAVFTSKISKTTTNYEDV